MKIRLSLFCIAVVLCTFNIADAQQFGSLNQGVYEQSASPQVSGDLLHQPGFPGRLWFEANYSSDGLGYNGSWLTLGGKTRLFTDRLDGRWVTEGQAHFALAEHGGFFANIGIERIFSIPAAGADVTVGFWYDYNGDRQFSNSHTFNQASVNASIKTDKWDLIGNGNFPTGIQDYVYGDLSGTNCFVGNDIVLIPGIDSALEGFDVRLRMRPKQFALVNGTFDIGGYQYSSDVVESFGGGRLGFGFQLLGGMLVRLEINQDDRFDTTGFVSAGWVFGANASGHGHEFSPLGRDLEQTVRNDHIVIYNREPVLAIDPETGVAYNVVHVDNTADDAFEDGTAETPFDDLASAEAMSMPGDVILVNSGDGTDRNMDMGITLQDGQRLWGNGQSLLIPVQDGVLFPLCTDPSGVTPTISNDGGLAVVTMADRNDIAGINIDATGAMFGIQGTGDTGTIRNNTISNATSDGVRLNGITGDWAITSNTFMTNGANGLFMLDALDTTSAIVFDSNTATGNIQDGIQVRNYDPASIMFTDNVTSNNLRHGMNLENYINSTGGDLTILRHTADSNAGSGLFANIGNGDFMLINSTITNNTNSGVLIRNWSTVDPEMVLIGTTVGGVSTISGNGALANLEINIDDPGLHTRVLVTDQTLSDGVSGLAARVEGISGGGVRSTLDIDIIDNIEINRNINDGISLSAFNSGLIRANIGNTDPASPLQIIDNANGSGDGISLIADGANGQPPAEIIASIDNVTISNQQSEIIRPGLPTLIASTDGIAIDGINNSVVDVTVTDSTIGAPANALGRVTQNGIRINLENNGSELINRITIDNITAFSEVGVSLFTGPDTYTDLVLVNSTLLPDGIQTVGGRSDNTPFTDGVGSIGLFVVAEGRAVPVMPLVANPFYPNSELRSFVQLVSDGDLDNLTQVTVVDNTIQDFQFQGANISTQGDAQMFLTMTGNNIFNNGAGFNNDTNNNNVFNEQAVDGTGVAQPDQLFFYDGVNIDAFDDSTISTRISGNTFRDNFERGLSLNTFNSATINAELVNNVFFGNDRGEDIDNTNPPIGVGTASGFTGPTATSGFADFEAINNEEYYFRNYESLIFINGTTGAPQDLAGMALPANSFGVFYPGNVGFDIFGNPVAFGTADMNLSMSNNSLQLGPDLINFAIPPGEFNLGLDGLSNGFTGGIPGINDVGFFAPGVLIDAEEAFFGAEGF